MWLPIESQRTTSLHQENQNHENHAKRKNDTPQQATQIHLSPPKSSHHIPFNCFVGNALKTHLRDEVAKPLTQTFRLNRLQRPHRSGSTNHSTFSMVQLNPSLFGKLPISLRSGIEVNAQLGSKASHRR